MPPTELDDTEIIPYQWDAFRTFISPIVGGIDGAVIEGLSFNAKGASKDILAGLQWYFITRMNEEFGIFLGRVPVTSWRSKVFTKEEQKAIKRANNGIKKATVEMLPADVREMFERYVIRHGMKLEAVWDLCDAYFLAQYRRSLAKS